MQQAICEHVGSSGIWIWANLVSPRCFMVQLPWKHVERLAILSAENRFRLAPCSLDKGIGRVTGPRHVCCARAIFGLLVILVGFGPHRLERRRKHVALFAAA